MDPHMENKERHMAQSTGSLEELYALLKEFDTAMLVTVTPDKRLRARPMAVQDPADLTDCDLWFVTGDDTAKVLEISQEEQTCVCAYRASDRAYLSISASARMVKDRLEIQRLWRPDWQFWFPKGMNDPTITLLKLRVERAEYWEPKGVGARLLYEKIKSVLTGEPLEANLPPPKHI
jgi:general stress protein 26